MVYRKLLKEHKKRFYKTEKVKPKNVVASTKRTKSRR